MSFGGLLAGAFAGAANVIGKQAGDDIEQSRKAELMRQQADIEEQMRMRLAEKQESIRRSGVMFDNTGEAADAKLGLRKRELAAQSEADINKAAGLIPVTQAAARASAATADDITKERGADKDYLKSLRVISAASAAPDRTDYKGRELDNALKQMQVDNANRVQALKKEFGSADPERRKQISEEVSILTGKDGDKFTPVPLKDEMGNITGYRVFDTKNGRFVDQDGGKGDDPIKAAMDAARAAKTGGSKDGGAPTATRKDPITNQELTEREWDRKYGRGDFKKLYRPGEDAIRPF